MFIARSIDKHLKKMLKQFPVLSLTGPRQSGKTTLLRNVFPDYKYVNLERLDQREMILEDTLGFLSSAGNKVIFDEAQNVPDLFSYIQVVSDEKSLPGQYILSGSQSFLMNEKISQSLAGRVSVNHLLPFDINELPAVMDKDICQIIFNGFYPRLHDAGIAATDFYPSYLQTCIERDIRTLKSIGDLNTFSRFMGLCAGRIGQVLNLTSLANDTGVAVNTAKAWLSLLEASFIVFQLQPFHRNFSKRLIKSPKLYFYDTGVACSLLRLAGADTLSTHYLYGALFENLVIGEIIKCLTHSGIRPRVWYWKESNGTEIDCIIEKGNSEIFTIEIKGGRTYSSDFLRHLKNFPESSLKVHKAVVFPGDSSAVVSGVSIVAWKDFPGFIQKIK